MGITKFNTVNAIWRHESRCVDDSGGAIRSSNSFNLNMKFQLLSTNDI